MANTHLRADGARATGAYEAFLPDGLLLHYFGIVDPASVTTASLVVTRTDGSAASLAAPPTITQVPGGVTIRIAGIGYSAPTYRVFRRARALPGRVRALKATRLDVTRVQLRWRAPRSSGALPVRRFSVRCSGHAASTRNRRVRIAAGAGTTCTVRARSAVGLGPVTRVRV